MIKLLKILTKWRKLILINLLIVTILSVVVSLQLPNWYTASSVIQPTSNSGGQGGLSSYLGLSSLNSLGLSLGLSGAEESTLLAILKSRKLATEVINKYKLKEFYERETLEETLLDFYSDYDVQPTEENMIQVSYEYTDSVKSAEIVNYIVDLLGKSVLELSNKLAEQEEFLIEKRYKENLAALDSLYDALENFQKKYGIIEFTEQTKALITAAANVEAELVSKKANLESYEKLFGKDHPYSKSISTQIQSLENEMDKIKSENQSQLKQPFNSLFVPFDQIPEIGKKYTKIYTAFLLESKLQEFLLPQLEQAKLKLSKQSPSFQIIDYAVPPDYKSKPKRSIIVLAAILLTFIFTFLVLQVIEHFQSMQLNRKEEFSDWVSIKNKWTKPFTKSPHN